MPLRHALDEMKHTSDTIKAFHSRNEACRIQDSIEMRQREVERSRKHAYTYTQAPATPRKEPRQMRNTRAKRNGEKTRSQTPVGIQSVRVMCTMYTRRIFFSALPGTWQLAKPRSQQHVCPDNVPM